MVALAWPARYKLVRLRHTVAAVVVVLSLVLVALVALVVAVMGLSEIPPVRVMLGQRIRVVGPVVDIPVLPLAVVAL
jgi:hypothetical protein